MKKLIGFALLALVVSGCTDAQIANMSSLGQRHRIRQFSGGQVVGDWYSTGKIQNEEHSDGFYFKDDKTGNVVHVSGTLQITVE